MTLSTEADSRRLLEIFINLVSIPHTHTRTHTRAHAHAHTLQNSLYKLLKLCVLIMGWMASRVATTTLDGQTQQHQCETIQELQTQHVLPTLSHAHTHAQTHADTQTNMSTVHPVCVCD